MFFVDSATRIISVCAQSMSVRLLLTSTPSDIFKFDVRVSANHTPPNYVSVKVRFGQNWDDLDVEMLECPASVGNGESVPPLR